jgi:hypothetical protein
MTAVLLLFVTYLLTLLRILHFLYLCVYTVDIILKDAAINKLKDSPLYKLYAILFT